MSTVDISAGPGKARLCGAVAIIVLALALGSPAAAAPKGETVIVQVDHAKVMRLPAKAQTVIVGNPAIADVSVQRNGVMIVTGRSYGVTNLIALDAGGALLAESQLTVGASSDAIVTVQRGLDRESYSCTPQCRPAAQMGDAAAFFGQAIGQAASRNQAALSSGTP